MNHAAASLTERTARAGQWRLAGAAVGAASQFGMGVLLARLLTPADFGLVGLALVVIGLARPLSDLGMGAAIVQRAALTERHVRTAFTCSLIVGLTLGIVVFVAAPACADLMRNPQVRAVLRVLSLGFVFQGAGVVAWALLRRRLDLKAQAFIDVGSYLVGYGVVAVTIALRGGGVWSLAWGGLCQLALASALQLVAARHSVRPLLARRELADLLHFGIGSSLSGLVNYVALNVDNVVVGRWMGTASLGLYARAYGLMNVPYTYASSVMSGVLFPAFAEIQSDTERLRRAFLRTTELTALVAGPAMGTMAVVAPHFVRGLYGERWIGVVLPLQILCFAGYFRALYHLGGAVAQGVGRVYSELRRQAVYAALVIGGSLIGSGYGLSGVAIGVTVAIVYMFLAMGNLALAVTDTSWRIYARVQVRALIIAAVTSAAAATARVLVEASGGSSLAITGAALVAAAVPWTVGLLRILGDPDFDALRERLPRGALLCVRHRTAAKLRPAPPA